MNWELLVIIWVLCAGLCYFIARDRSPDSVGVATALGFFLGPLGILLTFIILPKRPGTPTAQSSNAGPTLTGSTNAGVIHTRNGIKLYKRDDKYIARGITFETLEQFDQWADKQ